MNWAHWLVTLSFLIGNVYLISYNRDLRNPNIKKRKPPVAKTGNR